MEEVVNERLSNSKINDMKHWSGLLIMVLLFCSCTSGLQEQPNIIYIMVDDLAYGDFHCYGQSEFQTPQIDKFAGEGLKFNHAYAAAPVCSPTRVAFMTGHYPARHEIGLREPLTMSEDDIHLGLPNDIPVISSLLKEMNYETALFGKWHLGVQKEFFPSQYGFDHFFGILSGAADYIDHRPFNKYGELLIKGNLHVLYENNTPVNRDGYLTDLITESAVSFINQPHNKPFFISIQYTTPHWPWQVPGSDPVADTISLTTGSKEVYARMLINLDENFGKLLDAVKANDYERNTLIILTSDNGGEIYSNEKPFKGKKLQLWEGGIRVPALVRWPGKTVPGTESNQPAITMDWTATILDVASYPHLKELDLDGISLKEHFSNPEEITDRIFYWRTSNRVQGNALRKGNWKYLQTKEGEFLFNLKDDPYEDRNEITNNLDKLLELKDEYSKLDNEMLKPILLER
jgi:arylsulfatase A-like enzyme